MKHDKSNALHSTKDETRRFQSKLVFDQFFPPNKKKQAHFYTLDDKTNPCITVFDSIKLSEVYLSFQMLVHNDIFCILPIITLQFQNDLHIFLLRLIG